MKLIPAIKFSSQILALEGYCHPGIFFEAIERGIIKELGKDKYSEHGEDGFVDPDGNFLDRDSALKWAIKNEGLTKKQVENIESIGGGGLETTGYEECFS